MINIIQSGIIFRSV